MIDVYHDMYHKYHDMYHEYHDMYHEYHDVYHGCIIESVDSISRDGTDTPYI